MEEGEPDEQVLTLDLQVISDEEWEVLMGSQLTPDGLLAAVLSSCRGKDSDAGYLGEDGIEDDDLLYAAEDEE